VLTQYCPKKDAKKQKKTIEPANQIILTTDELESLGSQHMKQFSRFTAIVNEEKQIQLLSIDETLDKYDIRAVEPTNQTEFQRICKPSSYDFDIISLDFNEKLPFYINRVDAEQAILRGLMFEIKYSPMIRSRDMRRNIISQAQNLVDICKGKNIIVSSACEKAIELRGPYDVSNLSLLFGLNQGDAKCAVTSNYRDLIMKVRSRKTALSALSITKVSDLDSDLFGTGDKNSYKHKLDDNTHNQNKKSKKRKKSHSS